MKYKGKDVTYHRYCQLQAAKRNHKWELQRMYGVYLTPHQMKMVKSGELKLC
jgi:hypothetical protein